MRWWIAFVGLLAAVSGFAPGAVLEQSPLAAQDAGGGDDGDDGADEGDDGADEGDDAVEDPDDQDPADESGGDEAGGDDTGGDEAGGDEAGGDEAGGDEAGGDEAGGDEAGGDEAGGDDTGGDDTGGDDTGGDDTGGDQAGGDQAGGDDGGDTGGDDEAAGGDDDSDGRDDDDSDGRDDDDGDDNSDDRDDGDDTSTEPEAMSWELASGDTAVDRAERDERDGIETDNEGFRYRRSEFVALDLTEQALAELKSSGFEVIDSEKLATVDSTLLLLRGPTQLVDEAALDVLVSLADPDTIGLNHLFDGSAVQTKRRRDRTVPERLACGCDIGLIDTGVATGLNYFKHVKLIQRAFNGTQPLPRLHGTAIAYLIAGTKGNPQGNTRIFVADIFSGPRETSGSSFALIKALDWLAAQGVPVINVSLSGPRNPTVASAIARIARRGHIIVAAAGNDGPAAPPVFPGAYDDVVGVTAVDAQNRVYRYANRGAHVDFSALGVAVAAIDAKGDVRDATGTSFAAPIIAARLAARMRKPDTAAARAALRALEAEARDLGPRGRDPIYGVGLIGSGE